MAHTARLSHREGGWREGHMAERPGELGVQLGKGPCRCVISGGTGLDWPGLGASLGPRVWMLLDEASWLEGSGQELKESP